MSRLLSWLLVTFWCSCLGRAALAQDPASAETLKIVGAKSSLLSSEKDVWGDVPDYVQGATLLRPSTGNELRFTAKKEVQVLLVASWFPEDLTPGSWYPTRTSQSQLYKQGWEVIGLMKKKNQEYNFVFRKNLKAGEEVKLHTRKVSPPFILIPAASQLAAIARTPVYRTAAHSLSLLKPSVPGPAAATGKAVLLRTAEPDLYEPFEVRGTLLRELVRQAVLLAAREELGLSTRDETLHEYWSAGPANGPLPLDVIVSATDDHRVKVTFCRLRETDADILWDGELQFPLEEDLILALTLKAELFSRKDFVDALKKAGFAGKANLTFDKKPAPEGISDTKLHLIPQYGAARQLHQLIKEEGESPERLAALARIYAHLGMLSEHFWYQGHKAFMARGLLYAERATARWPQSPTALYGRAYVRALIGLHGAALDDISAAAKLKGGEKAPEWMKGIESYCRYDLKQLDELAAVEKGLPRFLKLLAKDDIGSVNDIIRAAEGVIEDVVDSDRAMEACFQTNQLDVCGWASRQSLRRTSEVTLPHAERIPGLPAAAAKICKEESKSRAESELNELAEVQRRGAFIDVLREAAKTELDLPEPSWQVLATLVEETTFMEIQRILTFKMMNLAVSPEELRDELSPAVANHPMQAFLQNFRTEPVARRGYLDQFMKSAREPDLSLNQMPAMAHINQFGFPGVDRMGAIMLAHQDLIARDLWWTVNTFPPPGRKAFCREWRRISPHSPLPFALTIVNDWEFAAPLAQQWEQKFSLSPQVQIALGRKYLEDKKYDAAVRCLEQAATLARGLDVTTLLGRAWLEQKDEGKWKAVWDKYLSEEHPGLSNAQAQVAVARHFMVQGRFKEALPYAEGAAPSYSEWALVCMGDCLTGLKRYDDANKYFDANMRRYSPNGAITWYFWRIRNDQGNLEKTLQAILGFLAEPEVTVRIHPTFELPVLVLAGKKEDALRKYRQSVVKQPNPQFAWMAAILADELQEPRNRDIALGMVIESGKRPEFGTKNYVELAQLCQAALKEPAKLDALPKQVDAILAGSGDPEQRCTLAYLAGKFLDLHGRKTEGEALLKRAADSPFTQAEAALAAKELRDRKMEGKAGAIKDDTKK